jgi:hypothetical protein
MMHLADFGHALKLFVLPPPSQKHGHMEIVDMAILSTPFFENSFFKTIIIHTPPPHIPNPTPLSPPPLYPIYPPYTSDSPLSEVNPVIAFPGNPITGITENLVSGVVLEWRPWNLCLE